MISANVKLALRCRSMFSEKTSVLRARSGSPEKKSVSPRCIRKETKSATYGHKPEGDEGTGGGQPAASHVLVLRADARFRDTAADRPPPLARCRQERARRGHHGLALETGVSTSHRRGPKRPEKHTRADSRAHSPPQHDEWQIPMAATAGRVVGLGGGRRCRGRREMKLDRGWRFFVDAFAACCRAYYLGGGDGAATAKARPVSATSNGL